VSAAAVHSAADLAGMKVVYMVEALLKNGILSSYNVFSRY